MTVDPAERLVPERIREALPTARLGRRIYYWPEIGSTNDFALELARAGEPEGTLVVADAQRRGRGRAGHEWVSRPGRDLLVSLVLRQEGAPARILPISLVASLAVVTALSRHAPEPLGVKWPNDVVCERGKVAGILCEAVHRPAQAASIVLGMGIDVNSTAEDFPPGIPAVSLRMLAGRTLDRAEVLGDVLGSLETWIERFRRDGFAPLSGAYDDRLAVRGRRVRFSGGERSGRGVVLGVADDGGLRVGLDGGGAVVLYAETIEVES